MTVATKNGAVILKDGRFAAGCSCCGGACCGQSGCTQVSSPESCVGAFRGPGTTCASVSCVFQSCTNYRINGYPPTFTESSVITDTASCGCFCGQTLPWIGDNFFAPGIRCSGQDKIGFHAYGYPYGYTTVGYFGGYGPADPSGKAYTLFRSSQGISYSLLCGFPYRISFTTVESVSFHRGYSVDSNGQLLIGEDNGVVTYFREGSILLGTLINSNGVLSLSQVPVTYNLNSGMGEINPFYSEQTGNVSQKLLACASQCSGLLSISLTVS